LCGSGRWQHHVEIKFNWVDWRRAGRYYAREHARARLWREWREIVDGEWNLKTFPVV
jgi:hypothetical protein